MELARSAWLKTGSGARQESVLSPILFNSVMDETANKTEVENKRPDMKTLILADTMLIWGRNVQGTEEELNQGKIILKKSVLRTDMVPVKLTPRAQWLDKSTDQNNNL